MIQTTIQIIRKTGDSNSNDSEVLVSASTSKLYPNRSSTTTTTISQSSLPQPNPNLSSQSPPLGSRNMFLKILYESILWITKRFINLLDPVKWMPP
ncbi:hypothetical protein QE152_g22425 [Popillia japonica]|uniref:Uncharacterized protein n=1 Tax=Popillia japonica TaxID=7064 RepID=A0AAW1KIN7_POPJA